MIRFLIKFLIVFLTATMMFANPQYFTRRVANSNIITEIYNNTNLANILHDDQEFIHQNKIFLDCNYSNSVKENLILLKRSKIRTSEHINSIKVEKNEKNCGLQLIQILASVLKICTMFKFLESTVKIKLTEALIFTRYKKMLLENFLNVAMNFILMPNYANTKI